MTKSSSMFVSGPAMMHFVFLRIRVGSLHKMQDMIPIYFLSFTLVTIIQLVISSLNMYRQLLTVNAAIIALCFYSIFPLLQHVSIDSASSHYAADKTERWTLWYITSYCIHNCALQASVWEYKAAVFDNNPFIKCIELAENSSVLSVDTVIFISSILARWLKRVSIVIVICLGGLCNRKLNELPV